jgi:hypothetical protein
VAKPTKLSKTPLADKPPSKQQRAQARARRETKRDGKSMAETPLTKFVQTFCREYVRLGVLEDAHYNAEMMEREPLDLTGFEVIEEKWERTVKGKKVTGKTVTVIDPDTGREVGLNIIRTARAAQLYHMPEVQAELRRLRAEAAEHINITAQTLATKIALIQDHAIRTGQLQVALNGAAMEAKMFGIEAGPGEGGGTPVPAAAVNINIRDYTGKPKPRED